MSVTITRCPPGPIDPELTVEHERRFRHGKGYALKGRVDFKEAQTGFAIQCKREAYRYIPAFAANDEMLANVLRAHAVKLGAKYANTVDAMEALSQPYVLNCCRGHKQQEAVLSRNSSYLALCAAIAWMSWRRIPAMSAVDIAGETNIKANNVRQIRHRLLNTARALGYPTITTAQRDSRRHGGFASGHERDVRRIEAWKRSQ